MCQIIGTMTKPYIQIDTQGRTTLLAEAPHQATGGRMPPAYTVKPVHVKFRHDLTLELQGEHFKASCALEVDDVLALIGELSFVLREKLYCDSLYAKQDGADA